MFATVTRTRLLSAGLAILGMLLVTWPAFYNGYPLMYSDSGTYIRSAVELIPPVDRPIGYGVLIRLVGWEVTTWTTVLFQGFIIYWTTGRVMRLFFENHRLPHFVILGLLAVLSSLPWYAAQIMPDVFVGVVVLMVFLLFFDEAGWKRRLLYCLLTVFFMAFHYSFFLIVFLTGSCVILMHIRKIFTVHRKILFDFLCLNAFMGLTVLAVMTINYRYEGKFKFSFSSNVFLVAKFCDGEILSTYLKDNCGKKAVPFCSYKDSTLDNPMAFLWNSNFPIQHERLDWRVANDQCAVIVHDVFTIPKYRNMFVKEALRATVVQLQQNEIGSGLMPYIDSIGAPNYDLLNNYGAEYSAFINSRQNTEHMDDLTINRFNQWILIACTIALLFGLFYRPLSARFRDFLILCMAGVVFNAFVTAALANVYSRLQARITWLLVFAALIVIAALIRKYRFHKKSS